MSYELIDWLKDLCNQLDCPKPDEELLDTDSMEYQKRLGAWETQQVILRKLKYAIKAEYNRQDSACG